MRLSCSIKVMIHMTPVMLYVLNRWLRAVYGDTTCEVTYRSGSTAMRSTNRRQEGGPNCFFTNRVNKAWYRSVQRGTTGGK